MIIWTPVDLPNINGLTSDIKIIGYSYDLDTVNRFSYVPILA